MKEKYTCLLSIIILFLFSHISIAQCNDVSLNNLTNPGPYEVATLTEEDGIRNGPDYLEATIYYPINATKSLPSIAIVPGWGADPSSIEEWGPFFASHGIVSIIISTNSLYLDFTEERASALLDALETIKQENIRELSPLKGNLNLDKLAVSGWSMGGGGAQRAAVHDNTISAVVALCPYLGDFLLDHQSPVLIFSGENDPTAPPSEHADIQYSNTPNTTDKLLVEIENGDHSVANTPNGANGEIGKIALSWLKLYLEDNNCYCPLLKDNLLTNSSVTSKIEQNFDCESLGITNEEFTIGYYPNPTKNSVNFTVNKDIQYQLYSSLGQRILTGQLSENNNQIDLSRFSTGIYYLSIKNKIIKLIKTD
ncbi:T9SS type A sorting domain-containing protein [Polaribacter sp. Asnod1-A03]|uniref:poly(ethylene terephthalate) hydrolase family protein n=1 Tax=Polaribacter sp. Asnod1-A03 TaxID=3160581 RepID=UPI00386F70B3